MFWSREREEYVNCFALSVKFQYLRPRFNSLWWNQENGHTELHILEGCFVMAWKYIEKVLKTQVRQFRGASGLEDLLMHDNARTHRTYPLSKYLQTYDIAQTVSLPYSPNLNPKERSIVRRLKVPNFRSPNSSLILQALKGALLEEWHEISQDLINPLVKSMKSICDVCISIRDEHIPYGRKKIHKIWLDFFNIFQFP